MIFNCENVIMHLKKYHVCASVNSRWQDECDVVAILYFLINEDGLVSKRNIEAFWI